MTASSTPSPGFGPLVQVSPSRNGIVQRGGQADTAVVPACRVRSRIFIGPPSRISVPHPDSPRNGTKGQQAARREDGRLREPPERLLVDAPGVLPFSLWPAASSADAGATRCPMNSAFVSKPEKLFAPASSLPENRIARGAGPASARPAPSVAFPSRATSWSLRFNLLVTATTPGSTSSTYTFAVLPRGSLCDGSGNYP